MVWEKTGPTGKDGRCASMDEILSHSETKAQKENLSTPGSAPAPGSAPISHLQELISQKLQQTERLLTEVRRTEAEPGEAERLLKEAAATWTQAREVLEEVKELRVLYRQLDSSTVRA